MPEEKKFNLLEELFFDEYDQKLKEIKAQVDFTARESQEILKIIQNIKIESFDVQEFFIKRIPSAVAVLPNAPSYSFTSKLEKKMKLVTLLLIPDAVFKTNGFCQIDIGDIKQAFLSAPADFTDIGTQGIYLINSDVGVILPSQKKIEFFVATSGGAVNLTVLGALANYVEKK